MILSIDPGKSKTGVALYDSATKQVLWHEIVPTQEFAERFCSWQQRYPLEGIILGDGTLSKEFQKLIREKGNGLRLEVVDEAYSTLEARELYFQLYPPRGLRRLLPISLQAPARPIDDLVAIVLLERYYGEMPQISK